MKKIVLKLSCAALSVILLTSCTNSNILKTKDINEHISQKNVVLESNTELFEEYAEFFEEFSADFTLPGLYEGLIPQSICYEENHKVFIIGGYYEDAVLPSVLISVNASDGKFVSYHQIKNIDGSFYYGHAGGLACSEEYLFVTSESECRVLSLSTYFSAKSAKPVKFESNFKLNTKGSFAGYSDGVLWTGDFVESSDKAKKSVENITTLKSGETFYAYCEGYILEDGLPSVSKINSSSDGYIPDYMLAVPEQVQGITFTKSGKTVFTTSYGRRKNSYVYVFKDVLNSERVGTFNCDGNEIDLLACGSDLLDRKITAPPMAEGITTADGNVYLIFESGAAKYRSHRGKYPLDTSFKATIE